MPILFFPGALAFFPDASAAYNVQLQSLSSGRKDQGTPEGRGVSRGKSLLVAAIMDLVTSSCETGDSGSCFRPMLPGINIETRFMLLVYANRVY
jgi:hypothetical protein